MNQAVAIDAIEERLRAFVLDNELRREVRIQAERYLARLTSPVRVTLFGRECLGKRQILEGAAGKPLLPDGVHIPMLELRYGPTELAQITYADRSVTEQTEPLTAEMLEGAVLVAFELPRAILRRISVLDVFAEPTEADQCEAMQWAAPRTDIALWCSRQFDDLDRSIWSAVPEGIQDHAYLVLTGPENDLSPRASAAASEMFIEVCQIDPSRPVDENGVQTVVDRLVSHADLGRDADVDSAFMFLKRQEEQRSGGQQSGASGQGRAGSGLRPTTRPRTRPRTKPSPAVAEGEGTQATSGLPRRRPTRPRTRPRDPAFDVPVREAAPAEHREVMRTGLGFLRRRSRTMLEAVRETGAAEVAEQCTETLQHLGELFSAVDDSASGAITQLADMLMEAEDIVILLENEGGDEASAEAVSVLLQVRHDIEAALAA